MVYRNKIMVSLDGKIYPIDSKWKSDGTPYIQSKVLLEWFDDDILSLDDIKPLNRLQYFREYPSEELVTRDYLETKEQELKTLKRIYHAELLERYMNKLYGLTEGTKITCVGRTYFFNRLIKSKKDLTIVALCNSAKVDGTPSKRTRELPLKLIIVPHSEILTKLLREDLQ